MGVIIPKDVLTDIQMVVIDMLYMSKDSRNSMVKMAGALVFRDRETRERRAVDEITTTIESVAMYHDHDQTASGDTRDPRLDDGSLDL